MNDKLSDTLTKVKAQMLDDSDTTPPKENEMSDETTPKKGPKKRPAKKKVAAAPKAKAAKATKAAKAPKDDNVVTLAQLASKLKIEPRLARIKLRKAEGVERSEGRWEWKKDSGALAKVEKLLSA